ncbi:MAG: PQQ-binding-like beta-propeller repeat protein [Candidatus Acidiferrales bacterium]
MKTTLWHNLLRRCLFLAGAALGLWFIDISASAQAPGFFAGGPAVSITVAQANRGKSVYDDNCASCHGANLDDGQFGPPLRGSAFKVRWSSQSADALYSYIAAKMPPSAPAGLNDRAYADVEAYILHANGIAPGGAELAPARTQYDILASRLTNHDAIYKSVMAAREKLLSAMTPVTDAMLQHPADGDWLLWRRTYQNISFSPLKQISATNVHSLGVAWTLTLPVSANEITPLVHDGILFVESGASIQALGATTGEPLWQYTRSLPDGLHNGRDARIKHLAMYGNTLYAITPDGHVIALEAKTGKLIWDHEVLTRDQGLHEGEVDGVALHLDGGPLVAKGKLMIGTSLGINTGGGNFIIALDSATGNEVWRFHTIAQPGQPGGDSWNGAPIDQRFGAGVWTSGSYDPGRNLLYFGTGNTYDAGTLILPQPRAGDSRDALYTDSTVALDPDTGKLVWHFQHMNRDIWDLDWVFEQSLITLPLNGKPADLVVTGGKTAIFDAMDRATGKYEFSRDLGLQNVVTSIDPVTGKENTNPALEPVLGKTALLCPNSNGARNWPTTAFDPATDILYVPLVETCADYSWVPRSPGEIAAGGNDIRFATRPRPDSDGKFGRLEAINLATGKVVWIHRQRAPLVSSLLVTAGGLTFVASLDRSFTAYDASTGKQLWQTELNAVGNASPVTYSVRGQEYVAVVAGGGGPLSSGSGLTPEISSPAAGTTLWVFKLPSQ